MSLGSVILREARNRSRLSIRSLARAAGVSPTTVVRIESGESDPTVGMLVRLLGVAGFELADELRPIRVPSSARLAELAHAWRAGRDGGEPDWTRLRHALDLLSQHPAWIPAALQAEPAPSGSSVLDALLAGIAEKVADDAGLPRPEWTARVPGAASEWAPGGTPIMVKRWRAATPEQLRARNLVIDEESLWRKHDLHRDREPARA
jgi:transcriptional regulator with XRE-family HTH domain